MVNKNIRKTCLKTISLLLTLLMIVVSSQMDISVFANAVISDEASIFGYTIENQEVTLKHLKDRTLTHVEIPSEIEGYPVTKIAQSFCDRMDIESVVVPSSVKIIDSNAFESCRNLTEVTFKEGLEYIYARAFADCEKLNNISLPNSLHFLMQDSFDNTAYYNDFNNWVDGKVLYLSDFLLEVNGYEGVLEIREGTKKIAADACMGEKKITSVIMPEGITHIDYGAFSNCGLENINLPESLTVIDQLAFYQCSNLTKIKIGPNVKKISYQAFIRCSALATVEFSEGLEIIGQSAFESCTEIKEISIPNSVKTIEGWAFYDCNKLENLDLGNGVERIEQDAFCDCNIIKVIMPNSLNTLGWRAFADSYKLTNVVLSENLKIIPAEIFRSAAIEEIVIPDKVTAIFDGAFKKCDDLKEIRFGKNVTKFYEEAFSGCKGLKNVYYDGGITDWYNTTFEDDTSSPLWGGANMHFSAGVSPEFVIPDGTVKIPDYALYKVKAIKKITIPATVKKFGTDALFEAYNNEYDINYLGTLEDWCNINFNTVNNSSCYSTLYIDGAKVTSVTIPESIKAIGANTFRNIKSITDIKLHDGIKSIGEYAFYNTGFYLNQDNLDKYGVLYCGDYLIRAKKSVRTLEIKNTTKLIADRAFEDRSSLTEINIPDSVIRIGDEAFLDCERVSKITVGDGATYYGTIFNDCWKVKKVKIGKGKTRIEPEEFFWCLYIETVELPDTIKSIGKDAFWYCYTLSKINLPEGLESIYSGAFWGTTCRIIIPRSVTFIGSSAFSGKKVYGYKGSYAEKHYANSTSHTFVDVEGCGYLGHIGANCTTSVVCERCGETTSIESHKHINVTKTEGLKSTCTKKGYTNSTYCNDCKTWVITQRELDINKANHQNTTQFAEKAPTCNEVGYTAGVYCNDCKQWIKGHEVIKATGHTSKLYLHKKATLTKNGSEIYKCSVCKTVLSNEMHFFKPNSIYLSSNYYRYDGKVKTPKVIIDKVDGSKLVEGKDYTVSYASGRKKVGKYKVTVTFKGYYSGTKALYFDIYPNLTAPKTAKANLVGHDDVELRWSKVQNADGYYVYYRISGTKKYSDGEYLDGTYTFFENLADGKKYEFKIVPCVEFNYAIEDDNYKIVSIYTLKKVSTPTVSKHSNGKVKVSWTNIAGESGYQISKSTSKSKIGTITTYKTTSGKSKVMTAKKGKKYYYKVRAYKTVSGKKIYGPWSSVKAYKLK